MLKSLSVWSFVLDTLTILAALIVSLIRKNKELRPVRLYIASSLLFGVIPLLITHTEEGRILHYELFNIAIIIDLSILYYYYQTLLYRPALRYTLFTCYTIFAGLVLYLWLGPMHTFQKFWVTLYGIDNLFMTIPGFLYFYQIFRSDEISDFKTNPNFFVVCGIIFFYGTTFPFYISYNMMYDVTPGLYRVFVIVNNLLSAILFITIIKAYLCPQPEQR